jgi:hypothetical protein
MSGSAEPLPGSGADSTGDPADRPAPGPGHKAARGRPPTAGGADPPGQAEISGEGEPPPEDREGDVRYVPL